MAKDISEFPMFKRARDLLTKVLASNTVIVQGPTGSGKSTIGPAILLMNGMAEDGRIVVLVPRRIIAISLAEYVASLHGTEVGEVIGYHIGQDNQAPPSCQLVFMTEGILLQKIHQDPMLRGISVVMMDEVHERNVNQDLIKALIKLNTERTFKLVLMSATHDVKKLSANFGNAPIVDVEGRMFDVSVEYISETPRSLKDLIDQAAKETIRALQREHDGDVLVFMPDEETIHATIELIRRDMSVALNHRCRVHALYAQQGDQANKHALAPSLYRRVIVATNIAETSLTIDGVTCVIDSGLVKQVCKTDNSYSCLQITEHSKASADQRTGRAGRTRPGHCVRLFTRADFNLRDAYTAPEILRTDLNQVLLYLRCAGYSYDEAIALPYEDPPELTSWKDAFDQLVLLGALTEGGEVTDDGRVMNRLHMEPIVARMILSAIKYECVDQVVTVAAAMSATKQLLFRVREEAEMAKAAAVRSKFFDLQSDAITFYKVYQAWQKAGATKEWAIDNYVSFKALEQIERIRTQLIRDLTRMDIEISSTPASMINVRKAIASGLIVNIAVRGGGRHDYVCDGHRTFVFPGSVMFGQMLPQMLVCMKVQQSKNERSENVYLHVVHTIEQSWLTELIPAHLLKRTYYVRWESYERRLVVSEQLSYRNSHLYSAELEEVPEAAHEAVVEFFASAALQSYNRPTCAWTLASVVDQAALTRGGNRTELREPLKAALREVIAPIRFVKDLYGSNVAVSVDVFLSDADRARLAQQKAESDRLAAAFMAEQDRLAKDPAYQAKLAAERAAREAEEALRIQLEAETRAQLLSEFDVLEQRRVDLLGHANLPDWNDHMNYVNLKDSIRRGDPSRLVSVKMRRHGEVLDRIERELLPKREQTEQIICEIDALMPLCPLCGTAWESGKRCLGEHDARRLIPIPGKSRGTHQIGRFVTNRNELVAQCEISQGVVSISFTFPYKGLWQGKKFEKMVYEPNQAVLPVELADMRDLVIDAQRELAQTRLALAQIEAEVQAQQTALANGDVCVLVFTHMTSNGHVEATYQNRTYYVLWTPEGPKVGESWICTLPKLTEVGKIAQDVKPLRKIEGPATKQDLEAKRGEIVELFDGMLPDELLQ